MLAVFNFPNLNGYGDVIQRTECCYVKFIDTQMSVCLFLNLYVCLFMYLFISLSLLAGSQGPAAGSCGCFFMCVVEWWALKSGVPALLPSPLLLHPSQSCRAVLLLKVLQVTLFVQRAPCCGTVLLGGAQPRVQSAEGTTDAPQPSDPAGWRINHIPLK